MTKITDEELIRMARSVTNSHQVNDYTVGDVGCALLTHSGKIYTGVCIDTRSSMGFCAEHNAIGSMVTEGEARIERIVAVWTEKEDTYIVAPCGRCREFIYQIDEKNLDTQVLLDLDRRVPLRELLPEHNMFQKIELE